MAVGIPQLLLIVAISTFENDIMLCFNLRKQHSLLRNLCLRHK